MRVVAGTYVRPDHVRSGNQWISPARAELGVALLGLHPQAGGEELGLEGLVGRQAALGRLGGEAADRHRAGNPSARHDRSQTVGYLVRYRTRPRRGRHADRSASASYRLRTRRRRARPRRRSAQRDASAERTVARACPPGFVSAERLASEAARERRAQVNGLRPALRETRPAARAARLPLAQRAGARRRAADRSRPSPAAARAAARPACAAAPTRPPCARPRELRRRRGARRRRFVGARRARRRWSPTTRASSPSTGSGTPSSTAASPTSPTTRRRTGSTPPSARAACGASDDRGQTWRSIGDALPTQAVGSIAYAGGTLVIVTGDNVFGGGGTFAGLGAFRSTDGGATLAAVLRDPEGVIALQGRGRSQRAPNVFYAATGAGLFRSTRRRRDASPNVGLPVSPDVHGREPPTAGRARWPTWSPTSSSRVRRTRRPRRHAGRGARRRRLARRGQAEPVRLHRGARQRRLPLGHRRARLVRQGRRLPNRTALAAGRSPAASSSAPRRARRRTTATSTRSSQDAAKFTGEFLDTPLDLASAVADRTSPASTSPPTSA